MGLIHNEKADVLDVLPLLPAPRQYVPLVRGADNDVTFPQELQIGAGFSSKQHHLLVQDVLELLMPVDKHLRGTDRGALTKARCSVATSTLSRMYLLSQGFHGSNVDAASLSIVQQHPQNSKLCADGLSTAVWSPDKHVVIAVVNGVED